MGWVGKYFIIIIIIINNNNIILGDILHVFLSSTRIGTVTSPPSIVRFLVISRREWLG